MTGTADERRARREALARATARRCATINTFGRVSPGTVHLLNELRKQSGLGMDPLLFKLVRLGQKFGV